MKLNILVTGGSGFVGKWGLKYFHSMGHNVISMDLKPVHNADIVSLTGDITDRNSLKFPEIDYIINNKGDTL